MSNECDTVSDSSVQNCTRDDTILYEHEDDIDCYIECDAYEKYEYGSEECEKYIAERKAEREAKKNANYEIYDKRDGDYFGKYIKNKFVNRDQAFYQKGKAILALSEDWKQGIEDPDQN